jgi:outer membrane protein
VYAVCALAGILSCAAAPAMAETLMDIVAQAQAGDPEFQSAKFQNKADAEATRQAWARFLPHVHASANYNYTNQDIVSSDNTVYAVGATSYPDYGYDITMDQSIFDYANWTSLRAAKALKRESNAQFEAARQDLLLRVVQRYFTVLAASETADAAHSETRAVKEHLDLIDSKHARGAARDAELLDAQARFLQVQAKQVQADAAVRDAIAGLREVTGSSPGTLNVLSDQMVIKPLTPDNPQHWIDMAVANNPRIRAADEAAKRGREQVASERAERYPTVGMQVFSDRHKTLGSLFGGGSDIQEFGARLKVDVPIYEGGATSSKVREAKDLYEKAISDELHASRSAGREVEEAVDGIKTATSRVSALDASLHAQEQVVAQLASAYHAGVSPSVDYLDAERDLFLARAEYVRSRYDYALDTIKLRHAVGLLDIVDLAEINRSLVKKPDSADAAAAPAPDGADQGHDAPAK